MYAVSILCILLFVIIIRAFLERVNILFIYIEIIIFLCGRMHAFHRLRPRDSAPSHRRQSGSRPLEKIPGFVYCNMEESAPYAAAHGSSEEESPEVCMPTIKDIAKAAGVSHGTVSNVLNKRGCVSYEKILLVEETARAMGYTIDEKASTLRRGKARVLAVILPSITLTQYADLYTGILRCAESLGYAVRLFLTDDLTFVEQRAIDDALALKVSGVLAVSCFGDDLPYDALQKRKVPVLLLERPIDSSALPARTFDMGQAAGLLSRMIRERSPRPQHIAVVADCTRRGDQLAFVRALQSALPISDQDVLSAMRNPFSDPISGLMWHTPEPTVVICADEDTAARVRASFAQASSHAPDIYTLVSLRVAYSRDYHSVALNFRQMGHEAVESMVAALDGDAPLASRCYAPARISQAPSLPAVRIKKPLRVLAHHTPTIDALRALLPRFEHRMKVPVELYACRMNEMLSRLSSDDRDNWDVLRIDPIRLASIGERALLPLEEIDPDVGRAFEPLIPGAEREFSLIMGRPYAIPFEVSVQMLFYQKSLFENMGQRRAFLEHTGKELRVPRTYAEYDEISRFFCRAYWPDSPVLYGSTLALSHPMSMAVEYLPRLLSMGEPAYTDSGCLDLQTPQAIEALRRYLDSARYVSPKQAGSWGEIARDFIGDHTAMTILFSNHASYFVREQSRGTSSEIGFATIPGSHPLLGGASLGVGKKSRQPQEAYEFIRWACSEDLAPELVMLGGTSACSCVYEHREILDVYPWLTVIRENIRLGARRRLLLRSTVGHVPLEIESILSGHLLSAFSGLESPEQALAATQRALEAITGA